MKRLILAGAGHAHAQVLQDWAEAPLPGVEVMVVSPHALAPYSGMVPGWLAGTYAFDEVVIDFKKELDLLIQVLRFSILFYLFTLVIVLLSHHQH